MSEGNKANALEVSDTEKAKTLVEYSPQDWIDLKDMLDWWRSRAVRVNDGDGNARLTIPPGCA